jgi:hypothetical protein
VWRAIAIVVLVIAGVGAALAVALPADEAEAVRLPEAAMPGRLLVGFQDDRSLRWGDDRQGCSTAPSARGRP